jgi:quercetin dioxygenase-like cupin family protein
MKVNKIEESKLEVANRPIFSGTVRSQSLVSGQVTVGLVSFQANSRTAWHTHTHDQTLYIVEGKGVVANEQVENVVTPGMIVHVESGEKHWHGATKETNMAHLSILPQGSKTEVLEHVTNPAN